MSELQLKFLSVLPLISPKSLSDRCCSFLTGTFCNSGPIFSKLAPSPPLAVSTCKQSATYATRCLIIQFCHDAVFQGCLCQEYAFSIRKRNDEDSNMPDTFFLEVNGLVWQIFRHNVPGRQRLCIMKTYLCNFDPLNSTFIW